MKKKLYEKDLTGRYPVQNICPFKKTKSLCFIIFGVVTGTCPGEHEIQAPINATVNDCACNGEFCDITPGSAD